jgi:broad specificity phosphatase PhoE
MILKLVRHGQSKANTGELRTEEFGDHRIPLTELGHEQARRAGNAIGAEFIRNALCYASPFHRTRETIRSLLDGAGVSTDQPGLKIYEDPRLREVEHGYEDANLQKELRLIHGWFYYRFRGGESPADCYDRTSGFLEGMMRQLERKQIQKVLVVTHGLTIRCLVMRFLHMSVEEFESLDSPMNCDIITITNKSALKEPQFVSGKWGVTGLRIRAEASEGDRKK